MPTLRDRFPAAEDLLRDRLEDLLLPSEPEVETSVAEDSERRCWVAVACPRLGFRREAAFASEDLEEAGDAWLAWCERAVEDLDRRLRERAKSGW